MKKKSVIKILFIASLLGIAYFVYNASFNQSVLIYKWKSHALDVQKACFVDKDLYVLVKNVDLVNKKAEIGMYMIDTKANSIFLTSIKQENRNDEFIRYPVKQKEEALLRDAINSTNFYSYANKLIYSYYRNSNIGLKNTLTLGNHYTYTDHAHFLGIFDLKKNQKIWETELPEKNLYELWIFGENNSLLVAGNVYSHGRCLLKYVSESGKIIFKNQDTKESIKGSPVIYQNKIYLTSEELLNKSYPYKYVSYANCIDPETGKVLWNAKITDDRIAQYASPQVADNKIYVLTGMAETTVLHCLSADDGKQLWERKTPYAERIFLYPKDRAIYVTQMSGTVAYDTSTGWPKKKYTGFFSQVLQVASVNGLIIHNNGYALEVFDKRTAKLLQIIGVSKKQIEWQLDKTYGMGYALKGDVIGTISFFKLGQVRNLLKKPNGILETPVGKNMLVSDDMVYTYGDKGIFAYEIKK